MVDVAVYQSERKLLQSSVWYFLVYSVRYFDNTEYVVDN
jgi:hypothetical protein